MGTLIKFNRTIPLFERSIESVINDGFFSSFDTNIRDLSDKYLLQVAVPGMNKEHLNIQVNGNVLQVYGERAISTKNGMNQFTEFSSTQFSRSFILPEDANRETISAECSDGLLRIVVEKIELGSKVTQVEIGDGKKEKAGFFDKLFKSFRKKK